MYYEINYWYIENCLRREKSMDILTVLFIIFMIAIVLKNVAKNGRMQNRSDQTSQQRSVQRIASASTDTTPYFNAKQQAKMPQVAKTSSVISVEREREMNAGTDIFSRAKADTKSDIASIARQNHEENVADTGAVPTAAQLNFEFKEVVDLDMSVLAIAKKSELMKEISDLIVTGYTGSLTFERDFVAEGIDMLNRIDHSE